MSREALEENLHTRVHILEEKFILDREDFFRHVDAEEKSFREIHNILRATAAELKTVSAQLDQVVTVARDNSKSLSNVRMFQVKVNVIFGIIGVVATGVAGVVLKIMYDLVLAGQLG